MQRIALIEDDAIVRQATSQWLQLAGFDVTAFEVGQDALNAVEQGDFQTIITDVRLPDIDGVDLLGRFKGLVPDVPVILITGHGDVDMAVKALQQGAYDFIEKPFDPERLSQTVSEAVDKHQSGQDRNSRQNYLDNLKGIEQVLIGRSKVMCELREQIQKVASIDTNVIIYGETGCGKELVASCLHEFSQRKTHPFVPLNCGAIPENLFESELFGHEAGAFTGAAKRRIGKLEFADKGTVFLDEIESMPLSMQVKVLRTLQDNVVERVGGNQQQHVDLRVVSASKSDLLNHPDFRQDLFYRLNVAQLHLPPLSEREEDALLLFEHFTQEANSETRIASEADRYALLSYGWPGNVRE
ncbi:sigma-54-dependent transcriptional regulator, partial [Vibrio sp. 10N.222.54.A1]